MLEHRNIPAGRALLWVFFSVLIISGTVSLLWFYYLGVQSRNVNDKNFRIAKIVQSSATEETLPTVYFTELMELSADQQQNLHQFSTQTASDKLVSSPVIKKVQVDKVFPNTLYVDYTLREPAAYLADFENCAISNDGYIFPVTPFFSPKRIPELYLGLDISSIKSWGERIDNPNLELALQIINCLAEYRDYFEVLSLDVSEAYADSYGQREVIVVINDYDKRRVLRLSTAEFSQGVSNYMVLRDVLVDEETSLVVDLRLDQLAYIS